MERELTKNVKNRVKMGLFSAGLIALAAFAGCQTQSAPAEDAGPATARPTAEVIQEADRLYAGRDDLLKVRQAVLQLRRAAKTDATNYELAWRLAKFDYFLGSHSSDADEKSKSFAEGIEAGERAVGLQTGKPEGHFWLGANYGGRAQSTMLGGISDVGPIKTEMEAVLKIDEGYQSGSAYMVLGQVYLESAKIMGGDPQRAADYLEKGLKFGPDNSLLRLHLAEAYNRLNRNADALKQIDELLAMKPNPDFIPEHNEAVTQARKLREKLN